MESHLSQTRRRLENFGLTKAKREYIETISQKEPKGDPEHTK